MAWIMNPLTGEFKILPDPVQGFQDRVMSRLPRIGAGTIGASRIRDANNLIFRQPPS